MAALNGRSQQLQMRTTRRGASATLIMTGTGTPAKQKFEQRAATMMAAKATGSVLLVNTSF
jgi:hypothetical protein